MLGKPETPPSPSLASNKITLQSEEWVTAVKHEDRKEREQIKCWKEVGKSRARRFQTHPAIPACPATRANMPSAGCELPRINIPPFVCLGKMAPVTMRTALITGIRGPCRSQKETPALVPLSGERSDPDSAITTGCTCRAFESPGVTRRVIDPTRGQTDCDRKALPPPPPPAFHLLEERVEIVEHGLAPGPLADAVAVEGVAVGGGLF